MGGWKTWTGVVGSGVTGVAILLGVELTPEQISGIQTMILGIIAWGIGHKMEKNTEAVKTETAVVASRLPTTVWPPEYQAKLTRDPAQTGK